MIVSLSLMILDHLPVVLNQQRPQQLLAEEVPLGEQNQLDSAMWLVQNKRSCSTNHRPLFVFVKSERKKNSHKMSINKLYLLVTSYILNRELRIETAGGDPSLEV